MIGDCCDGVSEDDEGGAKGNARTLLVGVFVVVVGVCVGLNPHISHRTCAPARAYVHVGHGADVGVCVTCVVVVPHTFGGLLVFTTGRGSTGSSSMFARTSKALTDADEGGGGGREALGTCLGEGGGGFFFFIFLSLLYIREGLIK